MRGGLDIGWWDRAEEECVCFGHFLRSAAIEYDQVVFGVGGSVRVVLGVEEAFCFDGDLGHLSDARCLQSAFEGGVSVGDQQYVDLSVWTDGSESDVIEGKGVGVVDLQL